MQFTIDRTDDPLPDDRRDAILAAPLFGQAFTDHMVTIRWDDARGWHDARVCKRSPFSIDPACAVLHYAQEIFEGMKAYRAADGATVLFRPEDNARRFSQSAIRMAMPPLPETLFLEAVTALVTIDHAWVPQGEGSLYLRPFMFADEVFLGVRPARSYIFCVIASPAAAYFRNADRSIRVWASDEYSRATQGGTGAVKCGGNYAGSLIAQAEAARHGCDQVLFVDAADIRWIEELGGMNIFFVLDDDSLVTPQLGTILPGITRDSVIAISREISLSVIERKYSLADCLRDCASGKIREVFACGTAAAIAAIGEIHSVAGVTIVGDGAEGVVTARIRDVLRSIQRGERADTKGWLTRVAVSCAA